MSYLGLEVAKPAKPAKKKDTYVFLKTSADQIITNEETDERLPEYLKNNIGTDLLWANASPTSNFAAQSISVDLTNYKKFAIVFAGIVASASSFKTIRFTEEYIVSNDDFIAATTINLGSGVVAYWHRKFSLSNKNNLTFADGADSGNTNNAILVPLYVYGIK